MLLQQRFWLTILLYSRGSLNGNFLSFSAIQNCHSELLNPNLTKVLFLFSQSLFSLSFLPFDQTIIKPSFPISQISHFKLSHVLFLVTLKALSALSFSSKPLDCFFSANKAAYHEVASFIRYQCKREVNYERTL